MDLGSEIKSGESKDYTLLSHSLKPIDNFFNSTIVINDSYFENRKPNSLNTLGYDTFLIPIENENNTVIQNNSSYAKSVRSPSDHFDFFYPTEIRIYPNKNAGQALIPSKIFNGNIRNESEVVDWVLSITEKNPSL